MYEFTNILGNHQELGQVYFITWVLPRKVYISNNIE